MLKVKKREPIEELQRDSVTGRIYNKLKNPLNKKKLTSYELDSLFFQND